MQILASPFYGVSGDFQSIATTTVGAGGAATITFSSIPSTYKHLQVRALAKTNRVDYNDEAIIRFNSDSSALYTYHELVGVGAGTAAFGEANLTGTPAFLTAGSYLSTNVFGISILDILDYANTNKFKTVRNLGGTDSNGGGRVALQSGAWRSTTAISSITLVPKNGTLFSEYSSFALYGIKG